jgi:hypothetical protein
MTTKETIKETISKVLTNYFEKKHKHIFFKIPPYEKFQIIKAYANTSQLNRFHTPLGEIYETLYSSYSNSHSTGKQSDGKIPIKKIPFLIERFVNYIYCNIMGVGSPLKLNRKQVKYLFLKKLNKKEYGIKKLGKKEYYITKDFKIPELINLTLLYLQSKNFYQMWQRAFKRKGYSSKSFQKWIIRKRKLNIIPKAVFLILPPLPEKTIYINGEKIYLKSSVDFLLSLKKPLFQTNYTSIEKFLYSLRMGGVVALLKHCKEYLYLLYKIYPQECNEFVEWLSQQGEMAVERKDEKIEQLEINQLLNFIFELLPFFTLDTYYPFS